MISANIAQFRDHLQFMENINCSEHNCTESHVSNIFFFSMETRRHFTIYQQVCCQNRVEGLLPTHCACPGIAQLSLMYGRNSCIFPAVLLALQLLAEHQATCCIVTFLQGQLRISVFITGMMSMPQQFGEVGYLIPYSMSRALALTQKELCTGLPPIWNMSLIFCFSKDSLFCFVHCPLSVFNFFTLEFLPNIVIVIVGEEGHSRGLVRPHFELFFQKGRSKGRNKPALFATESPLPRMVPGTWCPINIIGLINERMAVREDIIGSPAWQFSIFLLTSGKRIVSCWAGIRDGKNSSTLNCYQLYSFAL